MSTIKTISYHESKESVDAIGLKKWVKIGIEVAVDENDDTQKAFEQAKEIIQKWHQPTIDEMPKPHPVTEVSRPAFERIKAYIATIEMCTSLKFLENFKTRVEKENNPELTAAYESKLKQLQ